MAYLEGNIDQITYGTWTPTITCTGSNPTVGYARQTGKYTIIGDVVFCKADLILNSLSGGTGNLEVSLPFTTASTYYSIGALEVSNMTFSGDYNVAQAFPSSSVTTLESIRDANTSVILAIGDLASNSQITFTLQYQKS